MMSKKVYTVSDSEYADELIKLDFPENLITNAEDCKMYHDHCNQYNMKFLKGSYGTLIHKQFGDYFKKSNSRKIKLELKCANELTGKSNISLPLDHSNLFKSKINKSVYILTSSPYGSLDMETINNLKEYPYDSYIINPNFLDYHGFIGRVGEIRPPLWDVNYAFTNANPEDILEINRVIYDDIKVFLAFDYLL